MALDMRLAGLVSSAEFTGKRQEIKLERGLIVAVRVTAKSTRLEIRWNKGRPSLIEWQKVCAAWPYPVGEPVPVVGGDDGRGWLSAEWSTPVRLFPEVEKE